ncbi:head-tail adaptor protein (plasmid) [Halorarum halophilum]|uniref:Head-tail adaptor protein n=1 Tax=Halorarum halophilum TaxID=2743090 RepID=A0A7D5KPE5_9EURY|nr:head-tail adaptor protein [Halobaculum halophilum]QLG30175.1 head-tail adaptor protein [Halobaculum halophilum]
MPDFNVSDAIMNDGRWRTTVTVTPRGTVSNTGGYATETDGATVQVEAVIRPADVSRYAVIAEGLSNGADYVMFVRDDAQVSSGDQLDYRGTTYEVRGLELDPYDGLAVFELAEELS